MKKYILKKKQGGAGVIVAAVLLVIAVVLLITYRTAITGWLTSLTTAITTKISEFTA